MKAILYTADQPNKNGIVFPKKELKKAVKKYNMRGGRFVIYDDYPPKYSDGPDMEKVVGSAVLEMEDDGKVIADITFYKDFDLDPDNEILPTCTGVIDDEKVASQISIVDIVVVKEIKL